ncbi:probable glutathione peroxidase 8 isoform X1 [Benincasa hispida]|uniref:probable glutathione peroxidase 8 isoform X1 n=1 Tax=Benincasa hispida TaxID=102211 RepID=UPI0018FFB1DB|nr:probable glutathione peroxidase 8 isoform X1 [Benincasa hispida]
MNSCGIQIKDSGNLSVAETILNECVLGTYLILVLMFYLINEESRGTVVKTMAEFDAKGNDISLSIYKGKVLLIVNVASKCGMTNSNYLELNQLYEKYKEHVIAGLEILAFPCNQFGDEEPGSNDEIKDFVCSRFKSEFPIFDKIEVNGNNSAPLYKFLKLGKWGIFGDDIQWNFAKFLVDKDGKVVDRYYPTTSPLSIENDIKKLLEIL